MTAERLLALATSGLSARRAAWGVAMRAELAAVDDPCARQAFARSAAKAAFVRGYGLRLVFALGTGLFVAAFLVASSRMQLEAGGPGLLSVTIPVPAFTLLAVTLSTARLERSARFGLETGCLALVAAFAAVSAVVALEGQVWMDRHGIFVLDGDPPRRAASATDVALDLFTTGMWLGHLAFWVPFLVIGAVLGAAGRKSTGTRGRTLSAG